MPGSRSASNSGAGAGAGAGAGSDCDKAASLHNCKGKRREMREKRETVDSRRVYRRGGDASLIFLLFTFSALLLCFLQPGERPRGREDDKKSWEEL